jgi:hypothetical protein
MHSSNRNTHRRVRHGAKSKDFAIELNSRSSSAQIQLYVKKARFCSGPETRFREGLALRIQLELILFAGPLNCGAGLKE